MPYIITELCTNDGACVEVCPVACIHTQPGAPQHYVDPDVCIECEQCEIVCPVNAIFLDIKLPAQHEPSIEVNAAFFRKNKAAVEPVPLERAWEFIQAAQSYAAEKGMAISAAVVDEAGIPIAVGRMDSAEPRSADLAFDKAYTAATFHVSTAELAGMARQPWLQSFVISSRGKVLPAAGGIALIDGIAIVGAVGVAGGPTNEQDVLCARAGLSVVEAHSH